MIPVPCAQGFAGSLSSLCCCGCEVWAGIHGVKGKPLILWGKRGWIQVWVLVLLPPASQTGHVCQKCVRWGKGSYRGRTWSWCVPTSLFLLLLHSFCWAAKSHLSPFMFPCASGSSQCWSLDFVLCSSGSGNTVHKFKQLTQDGNWKPPYCHGDLGLL